MALFGLQHSLMARPWFKRRFMRRLPDAFERCTYVHMANLALFTLILCWQPISGDVWRLDNGSYRHTLWLLFTAGWLMRFLGAWEMAEMSRDCFLFQARMEAASRRSRVTHERELWFRSTPASVGSSLLNCLFGSEIAQL